jgi:surface antigen
VNLPLPAQPRGLASTAALLAVASLLAWCAVTLLPAAPAPRHEVAATAAYAAIDDYPYPATGPNATAPDTQDPWDFDTAECTSFAAWRIRQDLGMPDFSNHLDGGTFGDADTWADNALRIGLPVSTTPGVGTVAVFPPNTDWAGPSGHVAVVLSVGPGDTLGVEDYNFRDSEDAWQPFTYSRHSMPDLPADDGTPVEYISFPGTPTAAHAPPTTSGTTTTPRQGASSAPTPRPDYTNAPPPT